MWHTLFVKATDYIAVGYILQEVASVSLVIGVLVSGVWLVGGIGYIMGFLAEGQ